MDMSIMPSDLEKQPPLMMSPTGVELPQPGLSDWDTCQWAGLMTPPTAVNQTHPAKSMTPPAAINETHLP